jgi:predicted GH43/DUF377 family glycosyl hydrolase
MNTMTKAAGHAELLRRHPGNPLLTARDWPYPVNTVFNPGAIRMPNGETVLLVRCEDRRGISHLTVARSNDGVTDWRIDPEPTLAPDAINYPEGVWGLEDPRIVWVHEMERFVITYTSFSRGGPGVGLSTTRDFREFDRRGLLMSPEDKDAALFPRRFDGRWLLIHRPVPAVGRAHIWVSWSPDLRHWGDHSILLERRHGAWWDALKVGLSGPPIETPEGWLMMYHGVRTTASGALYRIGLALLDLENPLKVVLRGDEYIMGPEEQYEMIGDVGGVVFPCGHTIADDGDTIHFYYGAADTSVCRASGSLTEMLTWLKAHGRPGGIPYD